MDNASFFKVHIYGKEGGEENDEIEEEQQEDKLQQAQGKLQEPENDNKNCIVVSKWEANNPGEIQKWNSPLRVFKGCRGINCMTKVTKVL